jgi:hypothetical protein
MPLKSKHFKGDARFEACLVSDPAHVVPGERGPHVAKIQSAIIVLGAGIISPDEIRADFYGPTTARAVLHFKGHPRNILNTALHQRVPDDIVGKKTIAALDQEMFDLENRPDPNPPDSSRLVSLTIAGSPHDHSKCPKSAFPGPDGRVQHFGTPINPQGFGRKINIGGEHETDYLGFQDVTTEPINAGPTNRPLTATLPDNCSSDICLRDSPITKHGETEIARIAMSGCRLTISTNSFSAGSMETIAARLGTVIERHIIVDFKPPDALGPYILVAIMHPRPARRR